MKLVGYCRVSTGRQTEGTSLEAQEAKIRSFCAAHGHELVAVLVDAGLSGKAMSHRPELLRALAMVRAGMVDGLVVASVSRLSRSMADLAALIRDHFQPTRKAKRRSAALISIGEAFDTATPAGRAMAQLLGVFAELERAMISERTFEAAAYRKPQGLQTGCVGYGWRALGPVGSRNRKLVPVPAELEMVRLAKRMRAEGATLQSICDELHRLGHLSRCGRKFAPNQAARLCVATEPEAEAMAA